jgi:hypothetical protein
MYQLNYSFRKMYYIADLLFYGIQNYAGILLFTGSYLFSKQVNGTAILPGDTLSVCIFGSQSFVPVDHLKYSARHYIEGCGSSPTHHLMSLNPRMLNYRGR